MDAYLFIQRQLTPGILTLITAVIRQPRKREGKTQTRRGSPPAVNALESNAVAVAGPFLAAPPDSFLSGSFPNALAHSASGFDLVLPHKVSVDKLSQQLFPKQLQHVRYLLQSASRNKSNKDPSSSTSLFKKEKKVLSLLSSTFSYVWSFSGKEPKWMWAYA